MFVITVLAASVAIWAFGDLRRAMERFTGESLPAIKVSLEMAAVSAGVAAKAPEIMTARSEEERTSMTGEIEQLLSRLEGQVGNHPSLTEEQRQNSFGMIATFRTGIQGLDSKMHEKSMIEASISRKVSDMLAAHEAFLNELTPLVDEGNANLVTTGEQTIETSAQLIQDLLRGEVNALQAGLRLNANLRQLLATLARAAATVDFEAVAPLQDRFDAIVVDLLTYEALLPETKEANALKAYTEEILALSEGEDSMFAIRATELDFNKSLTFQETLDLKEKRTALDTKLAELEAQFSSKVEPVVNAATRNLALGSRKLNATISDTIGGLVNGDMARLQVMLQLAAEANLAAGLLNSAASAPDAAALTALAARFDTARDDVEKDIAAFTAQAENQSIPELATQMVNFGAGAEGIFALRQKQLELEAGALNALAESRTTSETIKSSVETLVGNAETAAAESEMQALKVIQDSQNLLFAAVAISAAAGILIGWLLVSQQVVRRLTGLADTMGVIADGDLETEVNTSGRDEISAMARTVEVFRDNGREVERLRTEQQRAEARATEERRKAMVNLADTFEQSVKAIVDQVGRSAEEMEKSSETMVNASEQVRMESSGVLSVAEVTSSNVSTVAAAAEQLAASVQEISANISETSRVAQQAADKAQMTDRIVASLDEESQKIGEVVKLITDIAEQTNLLALNATIEAARAGDAGKGFAVVASEVKNLATQTAKATEEISAQIDAVQANTNQAVDAIREIGTLIGDMTEKMVAVSSAVEEQGASTDEIARSSSEAAQSTSQVSATMDGMMGVAGEAGTTADQVLSAAKGVASQAQTLNREVATFLNKVRNDS
ncbi:methyl-accepting chemotaxis protein [Nisaea acidiphila]|uniref:Methyl-accepting chemotaxis protein n=1 Tax=Nisaea acidiphila TaxID=1862145 RepID=A0A9J7B2U7_9PROT|nr:HAMP domain-containing methyl-accepting chemotaxis protein [Nisaea acidiphila]UUX51973.1 methyl-accepting chemotaxis protein [Nisaea acidiphila]